MIAEGAAAQFAFRAAPTQAARTASCHAGAGPQGLTGPQTETPAAFLAISGSLLWRRVPSAAGFGSFPGLLRGCPRSQALGKSCPTNAELSGWRQMTRDSEVSQLSSPLKCLIARTIAAEESVTDD